MAAERKCTGNCLKLIEELTLKVNRLEARVEKLDRRESENKINCNVGEQPKGINNSWVNVARGGRVRGENVVRRRSEGSLPISNRFEILGNESEESRVLVVGDSNIHRIRNSIFHSVKRENKKKIRVVGLSGAKVDDCARVVSTELAKERGKKIKVIVNVGTNDVGKIGSQEVLTKLRDLIRSAKAARGGVDITLLSIPSRVDEGEYIYSRSESINNQMSRLVWSENASWIDLRPKLDRCKFSLARDGVHYSRQGAQIVGNLLGQEAETFLG